MNNPMQMLQMIKNPQSLMQMITNNPQVANNPIMQNALTMMQQGNTKGIEELTRNLCREKNINPDDMLAQIKQQMGMR